MVLSSLISCLTYHSLLLTRPILLKRQVLPPVPFSHDPDIHLVRRWVLSACSAHADWLLHNVRKKMAGEHGECGPLHAWKGP